MTQQRIVELGQPTTGPRALRLRAASEALAILALGAFAAWAAVGAIEWASRALAGR